MPQDVDGAWKSYTDVVELEAGVSPALVATNGKCGLRVELENLALVV